MGLSLARVRLDLHMKSLFVHVKRRFEILRFVENLESTDIEQLS